MIQLTRSYPFAASHRLHRADLPAEQNREIYGKCNNPYGHGHNYTVEVTVAGPVDARLGRVVDVSVLDELVRETVIAPVDHRNLNEDVAEFRELVPTTENLAYVLRERLLAKWPENFPRLRRLRIFETRKNMFEIHESL